VSHLGFSVTACDYSDLPQFGPDHLLARLAARERVPAAFPLLHRGETPEPSRSEFTDPTRLAAILGAANGEDRRPKTGEEVHFVVTGQQTGLLTGPLYSFLKAVTVIRLAADLEAASGLRHIPLFWMASEDHDLLEVNRCTVNGRLFVAGGRESSLPARRPQVAHIPLAPHREALLDFLGETLPVDRPDGRKTLDMVASCPFDNYALFFQSLMKKLFRDQFLHFIDPLALRPLTGPVLARLVARWPETLAAFDAGVTVLRSLDFTPPLAQPGLFEIVNGARVKVAITAEGAALSTGPCSLEEAADTIRRHPDRFSPNAALRPILQDAVIPVSAYVAGPSELLYLWQIDAVYQVAGVRRALLRPRISATFIEPKMRRIALRFGLPGAKIFSARALLDSYSPSGNGDNPELDTIRNAGRTLLEGLDRFLGATPDRVVDRTRRTIASQVQKVTKRIRGIEATRAGIGRNNLEKLAAGLLPGGKLQERTTGVVEFVARHGHDFVSRTLKELDPWKAAHFAVDIIPGRDRRNPDDDKD
jgi:bacillithiol synthase